MLEKANECGLNTDGATDTWLANSRLVHLESRELAPQNARRRRGTNIGVCATHEIAVDNGLPSLGRNNHRLNTVASADLFCDEAGGLHDAKEFNEG